MLQWDGGSVIDSDQFGRTFTIVGSSKHHGEDRRRVVCAVVTVSDSRDHTTDRSGAEIRGCLSAAGHDVLWSEIVRDDPPAVREVIDRAVTDPSVEVVLLSGGTGIAPRDNTFEVVDGLLGRRIDGFGELFRSLSFEEIGAAAMLSRAVAGLVGTTVLFSMPGSTAACRLAMERLVVPELGHLVALARTGPENARP